MGRKIFLGIAGLAVIILVGDFVGVFGVRKVDMSDLLHLRVKPVDSKTGQVVSDVHVTCIRHKSEEACSQKSPSGDGVLTLNFLVGKTVQLTRLLKIKKSEDLWLRDDGLVVLVFIQPNYDRYFLQVRSGDLREWGDRVKVVPMDLTPDTSTSGTTP